MEVPAGQLEAEGQARDASIEKIAQRSQADMENASASINFLSSRLDEERQTRIEESKHIREHLRSLQTAPESISGTSSPSKPQPSSPTVDDLLSPQGGSGDAAAAVVNDLKISELAMGLEEERRTRMEEVQELARRNEAVSSRHATVNATVEALMREFEQERQARSSDFQAITEELAGAGQQGSGGGGGEALIKVTRLMREVEGERDVWRSAIQEMQLKIAGVSRSADE